MSSQTVATSTRGLPDFTPWPDTAELDHDDSHSNLEDEVEQPESDSPASHRASWREMDIHQRNQAVGNLLAALVPVSPTQTQLEPQTATAPAQPDFALPLDQQPIDDSDNIADALLPPLEPLNLNPDSEPHTSLPSLPPADQDQFLDATDLPPLPYTLPMDSFDHPIPEPLGPDVYPLTDSRYGSPPPTGSQIPSPEKREKRQVEAFAKLEFDDGNYYITTYACELGRDAFAYKAALAKEEAFKAGQDRAHSSSGRRSGLSQGVPMAADSQVQGSVVSEAGGFGGVDDPPILQDGKDEDGRPLQSHSSQMSAGSVVRPQEVLYHPPPAPFDYHRNAERQADAESRRKPQDPEDEQPAPVTDDHLPDANRCPLIPIHATQDEQKSEVDSHRNISRRHVRIEWSDKKECFQMHVLGKNGAFLDGCWCSRGQARKLRDGSKIQISGVEMTFRLPLEEAGESATEESGREDGYHSPPPPQRSTSPTSDEQDRSISPPRPGKGKTKIILKTSEPVPPPPPVLSEPAIGPDGQPIPPKRRGPGRPPKDGIMSTRERKEREKAAKLAEAKAANGGTTPPPFMRGGKPTKPITKEEETQVEAKPEKRKYKKRKREGEDGEIMQSIEGGEMELAAEPEKPPPPKKARSKSPSPDYPPVESLTEEQLARPSDPYARLIYDILLDIHPKALPLKQIYRALKMKFPFFVHRVDSEGWQSSVRHNLNQEWNKLFEKGEKEGKGFAWKAIPGALQPQAERRRAAQQASSSKPKPPPQPRQTAPQGPPQTLNWQNSTPYSQNGMPPQGGYPPFYGQGTNGSAPPPNGMPWPPPSQAPAYPNGKPGFYPGSQAGAPNQPSQAGTRNPSNQGPYRPPGASSTPVPAPSVPASTSASRNMPCTLDGLITIKTFENAMLKTVHPSGLEKWQKIFASARNRLLHGHLESLVPGGEGEEEATIMKHIREFIERFKNPNFVGFSAATGSPAPMSAANSNAKIGTSTAALPATTAPAPAQGNSSTAVNETLQTPTTKTAAVAVAELSKTENATESAVPTASLSNPLA